MPVVSISLSAETYNEVIDYKGEVNSEIIEELVKKGLEQEKGAYDED